MPWGAALVSLLAGLIGVGVGAVAVYLFGFPPAAETVLQPEVVRTEVVRLEQPFRTATQVAEQVIPSIVEVRLFASSEEELPPSLIGSGSGVIYRAEGYVITNEHVVRRFDEIRVVLFDGRSYRAELVGMDAHTDLAVLRISASDLAPISLGSTESARIGDPAIAVGNPLGLEGGPSVTVGVISAFERTLRTPGGNLFGMLQTDAPITRGSSGGALVDPLGRLLGITTAIGVSDVGAEGLGFATPVEVVRDVVEDLIRDGEVRHAFLGIEGITSFERRDDGGEVAAGAEIRNFLPGSTIQAAGARVGDVIVGLEGTPIATMADLVVQLRYYRAGDEVELTVRRGQQVLELTVELDLRPE